MRHGKPSHNRGGAFRPGAVTERRLRVTWRDPYLPGAYGTSVLKPQDGLVEVRRANTEEAREIPEVWLRSREASAPAIPLPVHSDEEVRAWFADVVLATKEVWVTEVGGTVVALLVLDDDWVDQLYVAPGHTASGSARSSWRLPSRSGLRGSGFGPSRRIEALDASTSVMISRRLRPPTATTKKVVLMFVTSGALPPPNAGRRARGAIRRDWRGCPSFFGKGAWGARA